MEEGVVSGMSMEHRHGKDDESEKKMFTYFMQPDGGGLIKIGRAKDVQRRLADLQTSSPARLLCLGWIAEDRERALHNRFRHLRMNGEWFRPDGELLKYIKENASDVRSPEDDVSLAIGWVVLRWRREAKTEWVPGDDEEAMWIRLDEIGGFYIDESCDGHVDDHDAAGDCPLCNYTEAVNAVVEAKPAGILWNEDDHTFRAVFARPTIQVAREVIIDLLADAVWGFDMVEIELLASFVSPDGTVEDIPVLDLACARERVA